MLFDKIILDFDGTIWDKDNLNIDISKEILNLLNNKFKYNSIIVSGNTYSSISDRINLVNNILDFNVDILANFNSCLYNSGKLKCYMDKLDISDSSNHIVNYIKTCLNMNPIIVGNEDYFISNIKIKPLEESYRQYLCDLFNNNIFNHLNIRNCKAIKAGRTTLDIIHINNNKSLAYDFLKLSDYKTIYIGDEVIKGNDSSIAELCDLSINVNNINQTLEILKIL